LAHHDEYARPTSQSKAFSVREVQEYRNRLYAKNPEFKSIVRTEEEGWRSVSPSTEDRSIYEAIRRQYPDEYAFTIAPWRFPLWQVANEPEFFAYKAGNRVDGVMSN
jgi:hypothetical protein